MVQGQANITLSFSCSLGEVGLALFWESDHVLFKLWERGFE